MKKLNFYIIKEDSIFIPVCHKLVIVLFLLISAPAIGQGPVDGFMKGKGNLSMGLSYNYEKSSLFFAGNNKINLARTIQSLSLFGIYGISKKLDVQISVPYINMNNGGESNLQDASLYFKYALFKKNKFQLMGALGGYLPLSNYETGGGNAIGQQNTAIDTRLISQYFFDNGHFFTVQAGYFFKSSPTPSSLSASIKYGIASSKIYLDFWYEFHTSFGGTDYQGIGDLNPSTQGGFKSLGFGYHKIGMTAYKEIAKSFGVFTNIAYTPLGRNIGQGIRLGIGFTYNLNK